MSSIFRFFRCISSNHLPLSIDLVRTELVRAHHAGRFYDRSWGNAQCRRAAASGGIAAVATNATALNHSVPLHFKR